MVQERIMPDRKICVDCNRIKEVRPTQYSVSEPPVLICLKCHMKRKITSVFTFHPVKNEAQAKLYQDNRNKALEFAQMLIDNCPEEGVELDEALRKIDEAVMWANAAIARHS